MSTTTHVGDVGVRSDRGAFAGSDWALFSTLGLIWGSSFLLIKIALGSLQPGVITWGRVGLGAVALMFFGGNRVKIEPGDRSKVLLLSLVWVAIPFTLYPLAEQHISSAVTGLLTGATPFFTGLFAALWFGRSPGRAQKLGTVIGFAGVALITVGSGTEGGTAPIGVVMVLAATICYGLAANLAGPLQRRYGPVPVMGRVLAWATLWAAPFGIIGLPGSRPEGSTITATVVLGLLGTGLAFVVMASLIGRVGGTRASFITYLIPLVALILGAALLGERVTIPALVGAGLVLAASVFASRPE